MEWMDEQVMGREGVVGTSREGMEKHVVGREGKEGDRAAMGGILGIVEMPTNRSSQLLRSKSSRSSCSSALEQEQSCILE